MTALSLASVLRDSARRYPSAVAVVDGPDRWTYRQLWQAAMQSAADVGTLCPQPDGPVALLASNSPRFIASYFGILAAGGVVVPVPTMLKANEVAHMLQVSGARLLLHEEEFTELAAAAVTALGRPVPVAVTPFRPDAAQPSHGGADMVCRQAEDPATIFFTSGTSGSPKGAVLTQLNLVMNATVNAFDLNAYSTDDVTLGCLPLFHVYGQTVTMNAVFRAGARLVLQRRFDPKEALDLMDREGATSFVGVPTMLIRLLDEARGRTSVPQLSSVTSGGAPLPLAVLEQFEQTFGTTVLEGYGLSETSPTCTINQPALGTRPGTVGHPIWGVDVEIADPAVDDAVVLLPVGELGEVVVRGHNVFARYVGDEAATTAAVVDGWFRTGDLGRQDHDGFITLVDRKKDLIIRGGYNVYPREVEEAIAHLPGVAQVAVVGLPDAVLGEEVCAVVVPLAGYELTQEQVLDWSRQHLGRQKYPRRVVLVDQLPMGPSQKVLKRELRATLRVVEPAPVPD